MGSASTPLVGRIVKHLQPEVSNMVDAICALGCKHVTACIESLQMGGASREYEHLTADQRDQLLEELQAIMSVYEQRPCS